MAIRYYPVDPPVVRAECHSDDHNVEVEFDAGRWFEEASDEELVELAECDWGGDYAADRVAEFTADFDPAVQKMFDYLEIIRDDWSKKDLRGFECYVDAGNAEAWVKAHRPHLYARLFTGGDQCPST